MAKYEELEDRAVIFNIDQHKGRGIFSKRPFTAGDVIFEERPLVSCQFAWNELYKYSACDMCLRSLETAEDMSRRLSGNGSLILPHPECCAVDPSLHSQCPQCGVAYCNYACRKMAWETHHSTLCTGSLDLESRHPLHKLCDTWRNMHYPPESTSIMLIAKMIAIVKQSKDHHRVVEKFSKFCRNTVNVDKEIAHKLLGQQFQEQQEVLRSMVSDCLYEEKVDHWFTEEGFKSLFALIGTNGQGIGSSSLSIWAKNCESLSLPSTARQQLDSFIDQLYEDIDRVSGMFLDCEGSGLYELQSASNHSCVPNAQIAFTHGDHTLSLMAVREVKVGDEICISYLGDCDIARSRHSRQKILRENYLFTCDCTKCVAQADDEDVTSDEDMDESSDD